MCKELAMICMYYCYKRKGGKVLENSLRLRVPWKAAVFTQGLPEDI